LTVFVAQQAIAVLQLAGDRQVLLVMPGLNRLANQLTAARLECWLVEECTIVE
jgi:hypothetical protein